MKFKQILFLQILILFVLSCAGNECSSRQRAQSEGETCSSQKDCEFPLVCYQSSCSQRRPTNSSCSSEADCSSDVTNMRCSNGQCILEAINGESCVERSCTDYADCSSDVCVAKDCSSDTQCGFNYYCSESKCIKATSGGACSRDSMCLVSEVCGGGKCVKKYSGDIGSPCQSSEQCNIYNGIECDGNAQICKRNSYAGKECYVDSECGSGSCLCSGSSKVCFGYKGALQSAGCKDQWDSVSECLISNQCSRANSETCPKCYNDWLCYQFRCNANFANDPSMSPLDSACPGVSAPRPRTKGKSSKNIDSENDNNNNNNNNGYNIEGNNGGDQENNSNNGALLRPFSVLLSLILFIIQIQ